MPFSQLPISTLRFSFLFIFEHVFFTNQSIRPKPNKVLETVFPEYESEGTISQVTLLAVELGSKSGQILFWGRWGREGEWKYESISPKSVSDRQHDEWGL